jgi:Transglycosylase SLT domain
MQEVTDPAVLAQLNGAPARNPVSTAILQQESGTNPNSPTSIDGAVGMGQILPATFAQYAKAGENINNPNDNLAVHQRIIEDLSRKSGGDPARIAVGYFSGAGNIAPPDSPTPWKNDHKDGNGKSVSAYVSDVLGRIPNKQYADSGQIMTDGKVQSPQEVTDPAVLAMLNGTPKKQLPPVKEKPSDQNNDFLGRTAKYARQGISGISDAVNSMEANASNPDYSPLEDAMNVAGGAWNTLTAPIKSGLQPLVKQGAVNIGVPTSKAGLEDAAATVAGDVTALLPFGAAYAKRNAQLNALRPPIVDGTLPPSTRPPAGAPLLESPVVENAPPPPPPLNGGQSVPPTAKPLPEGVTRTDSGKPILFTQKSSDNAHGILRTALEEEGIKAENIASALESAQKTGLPLTALDVATKNVGGVQVQGNGLLKLGKAVANMRGQAMAIAGETAARGYESSKRISSAFDQNISNAPYYNVQGDAIQTMEGSGGHYDTAFSANKDVASPTINRILKTDAGKKALGYAADRMNAKMALMGVPDPELAQQASLAGDYAGGGISSGLKLQTLDYVKRGLDEQAQKAFLSGDKGLASDITAQKKSLVNEMDSLDVTAKKGKLGSYALARQTYATGAQVKDALEQGRNFMKQDPEEIAQFFKDSEIPNPQKAAYAAGARRALQDKIDNMRETANPVASLWKPALQKRLEPMFPDKKSYDAFAQHMEHEMTMHRTNQRLVTGSDTAANEELANMVREKSVLGKIIKGAIDPTGTAMSMGMDAMTKEMQKATSKMSKDTAAMLMRYLTSNDPNVWYDLADRINNPKNGFFYKEPKLSKGAK